MTGSQSYSMENLNTAYRHAFKERQVILSFDEFLDEVRQRPQSYTRNAAEYLCDTFMHFGVQEGEKGQPPRFTLFDLGTEKSGPIIGGRVYQKAIYDIIENFKKFGSAKLIHLTYAASYIV